jgi:hypothetical protein
MSAAVKHLTPVTLELGGKCPAIVDSLSSSWEMKVSLTLAYMICLLSHNCPHWLNTFASLFCAQNFML